MLHALVEYGRKANIVGEAGFTTKTIRWLINFNEQGKYVGILDLSDSDGRKSKGREFHRVPHLKFSGDTPMRQFLVDTAQYVLLFGEDNPDRKLKNKHEYFINLLREASAAEPFLSKIANALSDSKVREIISNDLQQQTPKAKASDNVTFALISDAGAKLWVEDNRWHDWWRGHFPTLFKQKKRAESSMRCFISGELVEPAQTHPKIKMLGDVGGNVETTLVGFNKEAFCSYGLEQSQNAAVSSDMAEQYAAVLNHLLSNNSKRLVGTKVVYWYTGDIKPEDDPMVSLFGGETFGEAMVDDEQTEEIQTSKRDRLQAENRVSELLDAIRTGKRPDLKQARYCALTLSGNAGRVVVREWMEGGFEELVSNINDWFDDLSISKLESTEDCKSPRLEGVITACLQERPSSQRYEDWIKSIAPYRNSLWKAAIGGRYHLMPRAIVEQVTKAHIASLLGNRFIPTMKQVSRSQRDFKKGKEDRRYSLNLLYTRLGIMRAHCNRLSRIKNKGDIKVENVLNVNHERESYHVGRLMAVLEMIQRHAQGELGATIAQTHYAAAAMRPIAALPRLQTLVQHHLPKIVPFSLRNQYQNLLTEINHAIKKGIPRTFDLEDQCLFHLGYYHQRAYMPYEESPHRHLTIKGEKVRSKSEVIVANLLAYMGYEYKYEQPLYYKDGEIVQTKDADAVKELWPDFTIVNTSLGKPVFIEHLGMMDNFAYKGDWEKKEKIYKQLGILSQAKGGPNGKLIVTEEKNGTINCDELMMQLKQVD